MSMEDELHDARDELIMRLPESLRDDWTIVPKRMLMQVFLVGLLFGAAAALMIVGFVWEVPSLRWAWPGVTAVLMISTKWLPWWRGDRLEAQLRRAVASEASNQAARPE